MTDPWAGFIVSSTAWIKVPGVSHREAIARVREAGFGGVEILCKAGHFEQGNASHVDDVAGALAEWPDAVVTFHAPFWDVDLASSDAAEWDQAMRDAMQALEVAALIRAENMTVHVRKVGMMGQWDATNLDAFNRALDRLVKAAATRKMTFAVENLPPPNFTSDEHDLLRLVEGYPADVVGVCIDTGHAHLGGRLVELARVLASRTYVTHLHDNFARGKDEHLNPGDGTIPWREYVEALRTGGFRGRPVIEVVREEPLGETLDALKTAIVATGLAELTWSNGQMV